MSLVVRKPAFCICENKDADQLRGNREADQRLCIRYTDSKIPLLSKSEISSFYPSSVAVLPGLYRTWSKTPKTGFLTTRLKKVPAIMKGNVAFLLSVPCSGRISKRKWGLPLPNGHEASIYLTPRSAKW